MRFRPKFAGILGLEPNFKGGFRGFGACPTDPSRSGPFEAKMGQMEHR